MKKLATVVQIPITLHDERLTTSEAMMGFETDGITDGDVDAEAARLILVDFLNQK